MNGLGLHNALETNWRAKLEELRAQSSLSNELEFLHPTLSGCDHKGVDPGATVIADSELISNADGMVVYLNREELYSTVFEIGLAINNNIPLIIALDKGIGEFDFQFNYEHQRQNKLNIPEGHTCNCQFTGEGDAAMNPYWFPLMYLIRTCEEVKIISTDKTRFAVDIFNAIESRFFSNELAAQAKKVKPIDDAEVIHFNEDMFVNSNGSTMPRSITMTLVKRNVSIVKTLKEMYTGQCQICGDTFVSKDKSNYSEVHHLVHLGNKGADELYNGIVVCPKHHRQLHYADVTLNGFDASKKIFNLSINGNPNEIKYKDEHFKIITEILKEEPERNESKEATKFNIDEFM